MFIIPRRNVDFEFKIFKYALNYIFFNRCPSEALNKFEERFANYLGVKQSIGVSSARKGLFLCLKALGIKCGDEIIISSMNYFAIPAVVKSLGFKLIFVDVEKDTANIDPEKIEEKITSKTKVIIVTHLFGRACNMDKIINIVKKNRLFLIEDCSQALGAEYKGKKLGTFGDVGIFSFGIGKSLMCFGGGMLVTNNESLAYIIREYLKGSNYLNKLKLINEIVKHFLVYLFTKPKVFAFFVFLPHLLCNYILNINILDILFGEKPRPIKLEYFSDKILKLNNFQAFIGLLQLEKLEKDIMGRIYNSFLLFNTFRNLNINLRESFARENVYSNYKIIINKKEKFRKYLLSRGIDTPREDIIACHKLNFLCSDNLYFPNSEFLNDRLCGIPNFYNLKESDIYYISDKVIKFLKAHN